VEDAVEAGEVELVRREVEPPHVERRAFSSLSRGS
jgi:hypothetical protein